MSTPDPRVAQDAPNYCEPGSYCGGCGRIVRPGLRGSCCIAVDAARLQSERDALLAALQALTDAAAKCGNLIPWAVYSAARTALANARGA